MMYDLGYPDPERLVTIAAVIVIFMFLWAFVYGVIT